MKGLCPREVRVGELSERFVAQMEGHSLIATDAVLAHP
jgi:hypothetical protein